MVPKPTNEELKFMGNSEKDVTKNGYKNDVSNKWRHHWSTKTVQV